MTSIDKDMVLRALTARSMHLTELCDQVGVPKSAKNEMLDVLHDLRSLGLVKELPGQRFRIADKKKPSLPGDGPNAAEKRREKRAARPTGNTVTGRFSAHARGFGFIAPEDDSDDVFVAPGQAGSAMHGDRVLAEVRPSAKGREGRVLEVLERGTKRLTGTITMVQGKPWLLPDDPRFYGAMHITGPLPPEAKPGVTLVADILHFPEEGEDVAEVRIASALGKAGVADVEVRKLKIRDGIIEEFPEEVLAEARRVPNPIPAADIAGREDLRHLPLVTIDPPDARDHDDAVWAEKLPDGTYRIVIAIADVAHYVRPGTAIDAEAETRGFTIYLPDRAIPMLPKEISSGMASLVPDEDRLTLGVEVIMRNDGALMSHRFIEGVMRSHGRLTYGSVARALGFTEEPPRDPRAESHLPLLKLLNEVSGILNRKRVARGSLNFDLPEPRVKLNDANEPVDVYRSKEDPGIKKAYSLVEELMLLANEVVGTELAARKLPALFRVHGKPDTEKVALFIQLAESLGHQLDEDAIDDPRKLAEFLTKIEGDPQAGPLGYLLLRAMQQATYDVNNIGHFALAAPFYLHFTSPIRRYPDLCVHRTVRDVIRGNPIDADELREKLGPIGRETSRLERRAMVLERDVVNLYRAILVRERVGEDFHGTVTGVTERGVYVSLDAPFVEVFLPLERLPGTYEMNELGTSLVAKGSGYSYTLGDPLEVRIESVSLENREVRGAPVAVAEASGWMPPPETVAERPMGRPGSGYGRGPRPMRDTVRGRDAGRRDGGRGGDDRRGGGSRDDDRKPRRNRQGDERPVSRRGKSFAKRQHAADGGARDGGGERRGAWEKNSKAGGKKKGPGGGHGHGPRKGTGGGKRKAKRAKR